LQLLAEVNTFRAAAISNAATGPTKKAAAPLKKTILLSCTGTFECYNPAAAVETQDFTLKMSGAGQLTIKAAPGCTTGALRPRITGAVDSLSSEFFYVGLVNPNSISEMGGVASLILDSVVLDGQYWRSDLNKYQNQRSGVYAMKAAGVTLTNVDLVNMYGRSMYGGGALWAMNTSLTLTNCKIQNANAVGDGGGIWAEAGDPSPKFMVFSNVAFIGNRALNGAGGAIAIVKSTPGAGAFKCTGGCSFTNNTASKCSVLMTDRSDVLYSVTEKPDTAGKTLSIDLGKGAVVSGNAAVNGLGFCGRAAGPFVATAFKNLPAGAAKMTPTAEFSDFIFSVPT